jgi:hypothetical protein
MEEMQSVRPDKAIRPKIWPKVDQSSVRPRRTNDNRPINKNNRRHAAAKLFIPQYASALSLNSRTTRLVRYNEARNLMARSPAMVEGSRQRVEPPYAALRLRASMLPVSRDTLLPVIRRRAAQPPLRHPGLRSGSIGEWATRYRRAWHAKAERLSAYRRHEPGRDG